MKSRRKKILVILLALLGVLIIAAALIIPRFIDLNRYNGLIVSTLEKALGGKVRLGHIRWGIAEDIWIEIDGISVVGNTAFPVDFEIPHISGDVSIIPLLSKKIIIEELLLNQPRVVVRLDSESPGETTSSPDSAESSGSEPMFEVMIEELFLREGRATLEDSLTFPGQKIVRNFRDASLEGVNILSPEMVFEVSMVDEAEPGLGAIKGKVTFTGLTKAFELENPKLVIEAKLPSLDVDAVKSYLNESSLAANLDGRLSLDITYESDFEDLLNFDGVLDLANVTCIDPTLWEIPLPSDETTITYALRFVQDDLAIDHFDIKVGGLALNGQALVADWSREPVLKNAALDGELPLIELIPLIPWEKFAEHAGVVRGLLEGGGRITIDKATLPELDLAETFDFEAVLSGLKVMARLSEFSTSASEALPPFEDIGSSIRMENKRLNIGEFSGRLGQIKLPRMTAEITDLFGQPELAARLEGRLTFKETPNEIVLKVLKTAGIEKLEGVLDVDLALQLDTARPEAYGLEGTVKPQDFKIGTSYSPALLEGLNAHVAITPEAAEITKCSSSVLVPAVEGSQGGTFTFELSGRVDNWRRDPSVTLRRMKTSEISLPWLTPLIPWEELGESAEVVRETFLAGGELIMKDLSFSKLDSRKLSEGFHSLLPNMGGAFGLTDVAILKVVDWLPGFRRISGHVTLDKGVLIGNDMTLKTRLLLLPDYDFRATNLTDLPKVSFTAKGPLQFEGLEDRKFNERLHQAGFKNLDVDVHTDVAGYIDLAKPETWELSGSLILNRISAETYPTGVILDNLRGKVSFSRKDSFDATISDLSGYVNQAPFRVNGQLSKVGMPQMLIDVDADAEQLDLRNVAALIGPLKEMGLTGTLDMDMDIYIPYANPIQTQLAGKAKLEGFGMTLFDHKITIENGNGELALEGDLARFRNMIFLLNDQEIRVSGQVKNPAQPDILVEGFSPYLDLDRLIPEQKASQEEDEAKDKTKSVNAADDKDSVQMTAQVKVAVQQGQFQNQEFQNLKVVADYDKGLVKHFEVAMGVAEGEILATGTAALRGPTKGSFTLDPDIKNVKIEHLKPFFRDGKPGAYGPLTVTGHLEGICADAAEFPACLRGDLKWNLGPGRLTELGIVGKTLARILTFVSFKVVRFNKVMDDVKGKGMSFHEIRGDASFDGGTAIVKDLFFDSNAVDLFSYGTVDMVNAQLDFETEVRIFHTLDKALGLVPLLGKAVSQMTNIYLTLKGDWANPKIGTAQTRMVTKPVKGMINVPKKALKRGEPGNDQPLVKDQID